MRLTTLKHQRQHGYRLRRIPGSHPCYAAFHVFCTRSRTLVGRLNCYRLDRLGCAAQLRGERHEFGLTNSAPRCVETMLSKVR